MMNIYRLNYNETITYHYTLESLYQAVESLSEPEILTYFETLVMPEFCKKGEGFFSFTMKEHPVYFEQWSECYSFPVPENIEAFAKWVEFLTAFSDDDDLCYCLESDGKYHTTTEEDSAQDWLESGDILGYVDGYEGLVTK